MQGRNFSDAQKYIQRRTHLSVSGKILRLQKRSGQGADVCRLLRESKQTRAVANRAAALPNFAKNGKHGYFREVRYGLDEGDYMYEFHIL